MDQKYCKISSSNKFNMIFFFVPFGWLQNNCEKYYNGNKWMEKSSSFIFMLLWDFED